MLVYGGKLPPHSDAGAGEIVVIFLEAIEQNRPVLAIWQQNAASDGGVAQSHRTFGTIEQVTISANGKVVSFSGDLDYRFEGTVGSDGAEFVLDITNGRAGTRQQTVLRPSSAIAPSIDAVWNKNSVIVNDTSTAYYCSMEESSSHADIKSIILGSVGALYGFIGLLTLAPGTPFIVGASVAAQGAMLAGGSLVDTLIPSSTDGPVKTLLLPERRMSRLSESGYSVAPDNAVTLTQVTIRNGHILSVQVASYDGLGTDTVSLRYILNKIGGKWENLLELDLGSDQNKRIEARAIAVISGIDIPNKLLGEAFDYRSNLAECDGGTMINYQTQGLSNSYMFPPWPSSARPTFNIQAGSVLSFVESPSASLTSNASVLTLESSPLALIWRLPQYGVSDPSNRGISLGTAGDEADMRRIVAQHGGAFLVYSWGGNGGPVLGYTAAQNSGVQIVPTTVRTDLVYMSVLQEEAFLKAV